MLHILIKNTIIQASGRVVGLLIGLVSVALLTRYLGQDGFGWYIVAFSWLQLFAIAVDFGLYMVGLRLLGEPNTNQQNVFSQVFWLRLFSAVVLVLIAPHIVWFMPYDFLIKIAVTILSWSFFFATVNQLLVISFQKTLRMGFVAGGEIVAKLASLIALWLVVRYDLGFVAAMTTAVVYGLVQFAILWSNLDLRHKLIWVWDRAVVQKILQQAWPLGVVLVLNTLYFKADTVILGWFWPAEEVGLYGAAYKVLEIVVSFPAMYLGLLLPYVSEWWSKNNKQLLQQALQKSFDISVMVVVPCVVVTVLVAEPIMQLIAGDAFIAAGQWLRLLIFAAGFVFFGQLFGHIMVGIGHQVSQMKRFGVVALVALVAYGIFIPLYGALAAAIITIAAEALAAIVLYWYVRSITQWNVLLGVAAKVVFAGFVSYGTLYGFLVHVNWIVASIATLVVYASILLMVRVVTIRQIQRFFS